MKPASETQAKLQRMRLRRLSMGAVAYLLMGGMIATMWGLGHLAGQLPAGAAEGRCVERRGRRFAERGERSSSGLAVRCTGKRSCAAAAAAAAAAE